jgi:hypothetical protein
MTVCFALSLKCVCANASTAANAAVQLVNDAVQFGISV